MSDLSAHTCCRHPGESYCWTERYPGRHRYVYVDGGVEGMLSISGRTVTVGKAQVLSDGPFCPAAAFLCLQVCKGHSPQTQLLKVKTLASSSLNSAPLLSVGRHQATENHQPTTWPAATVPDSS